jgi:hypothetical protein
VELIITPSKGKKSVSKTIRKRAGHTTAGPLNMASIIASRKVEHYGFLFNDLLILAKKTGLTSLMNLNYVAKAAKKKLGLKKWASDSNASSSGQTEEQSTENYEYTDQIVLTHTCSVLSAPL